jgi:hypothetical protein
MPKVDWAALSQVAVVSVIASVLFIVLLAGGIRYLSAAKIRTNQGRSGTVQLTAGYGLVGLAGLLVIYGIYLIMPAFR